ncbi:DUF4959 domain-containing protein [Niabella hirudinis]|uniref:DUF4959 domain-containing protein n=1 Tax=Niabella hirudinis TaxID=1285929 RepID=UPI003EBC86F8
MKQLYILACCVIVLQACRKTTDYNTVVSTDATSPGQVSDVQVQNGAGGATLTYTLPPSDNILFVEASYEIRPGVTRQSVSSFYKNTLTVEGFAIEGSYEVALAVVSRANVRSAPVKVTVNPTRPAYLLARDQIAINPTFGGVNVMLRNENKANVGVAILKYDSLYRYMRPVAQKFGTDTLVSNTVRGYDSVNYYWGFVTMDRFGNSSDTVFQWVKPFFEKRITGPGLTKSYPMLSDANAAWPVTNMFNDNLAMNNDAAACWRGLSAAFPVSCTFDLGASFRLSRYILYGRTGATYNFAWDNENPTEWTFWGTNVALPKDALLPMGATKGAVVGDWICLGRFLCPPIPSGQKTLTQADKEYFSAGFAFDFDLDLPPVRYMRFSSEGVFNEKPNCIINELRIFGQNVN